jgi:hypothetical protein
MEIPNVQPATAQSLKPVAVPIKQAQSLLGGKARSEIYQEVARGKLVALKDGNKTLIAVASIEAYMAALPRVTFKAYKPRKARSRRSA